MRAILESTIRAFVARGSGIDRRNVVPGLTSNDPPTGLYASVAPMSERALARSMRFQRIGPTESYTQTVNCIEAVYSVQWYRDGALDAAYKFADWVMSETGIAWADTAIVDGRILGANVYEGGTGYLDGETCVFSAADAPSPIIQANGYILTNGRGEANAILLTNAGEGYYEMPSIVIDSVNGSGAVTSPRGYGFAVKSPVAVRNITDMIAGDYEERAQVDLYVMYDRPLNDRDSGRVERIVGERESGGAKDIIDSAGSAITPEPPVNEDRLVYVFQTNLIPSSPDSSTMVGGAGDGIAIDRVAEWTKNNNQIADSGTGFHETTLFAAAAITPQHGRDLIATSPFITNYEGSVVATFPNIALTTFYTLIYYIKTTHAIPNQPAITSVRAVKRSAFAYNQRGFSVSIALTDFNSMVILENTLTNGGLIGLQLDLGVAIMPSATTEAQVDQVVKELNTQQSVSITPTRDTSFNLSGFNTRVTFLQYDLTTA